MGIATAPPKDAATLVDMAGIYIEQEFLLDNKHYPAAALSNLNSSLLSRKDLKST